MSNMSRREALTHFGLLTGATLLTAEILASPASANAYFQQGAGLTSTKLSENLYLIDGGGGNVAVLTGERTVVIDSKLPNVTKPLITEIGKVAGKQPGILINTHWHGDHVGSNVALGEAGAVIVAHENTRKRLSTDQVIEFMNSKSPAMAKPGLPVITFKENLTLNENGETIHLSSVAPAHTDTDIYVHFENANVMHCGDLYFNGLYPFIDYSSKGWIGGMITSAEKILSIVDDNTKIIPGHGPVSNKAALRGFRDMLVGIYLSIDKMVKAGKTEVEVVAAKPTAPFDAKWGNGFLKADQFAALAYRTIVKHSA